MATKATYFKISGTYEQIFNEICRHMQVFVFIDTMINNLKSNVSHIRTKYTSTSILLSISKT